MLELAKYIDHSALEPSLTEKDIKEACTAAKRYRFFSVCVNSCYVRQAKKYLKGTAVKVVSTVSFPLGAATTAAKLAEVRQALKHGADEIDMVMNIGAFKSKNYKYVKEEIQKVKKICKKKILKVIVETCLLTYQEKVKACKLIAAAGADFIKTSTGFSISGAKIEDVRLFKRICPKLKVKAAGGIKTLKSMLAMIKAGADRIGTSSSVGIIKETSPR